jgi:hypothetical protein
MPAQLEGNPVAGADREPALGDLVVGVELERRVEDDGVGPRGGVPLALEGAHPGHDRAVVEAHPEVERHRYAATTAFDDADQVGLPVADGHAVDERDGAVVGLPLGLEDEAGPVAAGNRRMGDAGRICQRPSSSVPSRAAKQAAESRRGSASQSIGPCVSTSAAVSVSPSSA